MTKDEELEHLWNLAVPKGKGWQQSDCPVLRADRGDVETVWKKLSVDVKTIELAIHAQARFRRDSRSAGDFVPQPKLLASWLRKKRWLDPIESHAELKQKQQLRICQYPVCNNPVHGPHFNRCTTHLNMTDTGKLTHSYAEEMRNYYKEHEEIKNYGRKECIDFMKRAFRGMKV